MTRPLPWTEVMEALGEQPFQDLKAALEQAGTEVLDHDAFLLTGAVGALLKEIMPHDAAPEVAEARAELSRSGLRERDPDAFWKRAFELSVAGYFKEPSRATRLTPFRVGARAQKAVWHSLEGLDLRPRLGEIRVPTLILHGRWDPVPLAASETLAARVPGARLVVFEDSGHALYTEETEKFVRELDAFLPKTADGRSDGRAD